MYDCTAIFRIPVLLTTAVLVYSVYNTDKKYVVLLTAVWFGTCDTWGSYSVHTSAVVFVPLVVISSSPTAVAYRTQCVYSR